MEEKFMRVLVMFDLPTGTKKTEKIVQNFANSSSRQAL